MRVLSNELGPRSITARTIAVAIADDERLEVWQDTILPVPEVGRCYITRIRKTDAPMPGLRRGERVLVLEVEVLG